MGAQEERLAEELKINAKLLRKTLKELEVQQLVKREHKKYKVVPPSLPLPVVYPSSFTGDEASPLPFPAGQAEA